MQDLGLGKGGGEGRGGGVLGQGEKLRTIRISREGGGGR